MGNKEQFTGICKFWKSENAYGFITCNETGKDVFVHKSGIIDAIKGNDKVTFNVEEGKKGLNAINVELV